MKPFALSDKTAQLILNEDIDLCEILVGRESRILEGEGVLIQEMYDEVARDHRLHPDDNFEEILEILYEQIADDHS